MGLATPLVCDGIFSATVWPTHIGALTIDGNEPISNPDYQRGQIAWRVADNGMVVGYGEAAVPAGEWSHVIFCHHPSAPSFVSVLKLAHPLRLQRPGVVRLDQISESDWRGAQHTPS